jgi:hypothetical protein
MARNVGLCNDPESGWHRDRLVEPELVHNTRYNRVRNTDHRVVPSGNNITDKVRVPEVNGQKPRDPCGD